MDVANLGRIFLSLALVVALIFLVGWMMKRTGLNRRWHGGASADGRLGIVSSLMIDPRRRLVLIRRDNKEHLLLLGANQDLVIESGNVKDSDAND